MHSPITTGFFCPPMERDSGKIAPIAQKDHILSCCIVQLPYERTRAILNYLMTVPIHTDDGNVVQHAHLLLLFISYPELQLVSYETEAPENSGEKKRYQELK